jgi:hypothetical protein
MGRFGLCLVLFSLVASLQCDVVSAAAPVPGSEACNAVLASYQPSQFNKIYIAPVLAQGFQVLDRSRIFSFTSSFFTVGTHSHHHAITSLCCVVPW